MDGSSVVFEDAAFFPVELEAALDPEALVFEVGAGASSDVRAAVLLAEEVVRSDAAVEI